jgi:hypothetical protein
MLSIAAAVSMVATWAGLLIGGVELLLCGIALEVRNRKHAG